MHLAPQAVIKLVEAKGPLFYGAAVEEGGRILVAVMLPSFHLAVKDPKINEVILRAGWPQGALVNSVVRAVRATE